MYFSTSIYYNLLDRECIAVMDEVKVESGFYAGTVFVVTMDSTGQHDMQHESNVNGRVLVGSFQCANANRLRQLLFDLSYINSLDQKKSFIKNSQLLNL